MHHTEITSQAQLKDDVKFIFNANGFKHEIVGKLVGITPYEISIRIDNKIGHKINDYGLTGVTDFVNCSPDFDLGI
jgi:hypothetical protein